MSHVDVMQHMTEGQRTQAFQDYMADQARQQTATLGTIKALMILWFVLTVVGGIVLIAAAATSSGL